MPELLDGFQRAQDRLGEGLGRWKAMADMPPEWRGSQPGWTVWSGLLREASGLGRAAWARITAWWVASRRSSRPMPTAVPAGRWGAAAVLGQQRLEWLLGSGIWFGVEFIDQVGAQATVGAAHGVGVTEIGSGRKRRVTCLRPPLCALAVAAATVCRGSGTLPRSTSAPPSTKMSRAFGAGCVTSLFPIGVAPEVTSSRPASIRNDVDLSQLGGPTSTRNSPAAISRF
jgi:hypothetical protein